MAEEEETLGTDEGRGTLRQRVWKVVRRLLDDAAAGDTKAAEVVLKHLVEPLPKDPAALVNIDARGNERPTGPPMPKGRALAEWLQDVAKITEEILADDEPEPPKLLVDTLIPDLADNGPDEPPRRRSPPALGPLD